MIVNHLHPLLIVAYVKHMLGDGTSQVRQLQRACKTPAISVCSRERGRKAW